MATHIVSFSGGKDSTAMLEFMVRYKNWPKPDYVIYFETGWEYPEIDTHINQVEYNTGLKITKLYPRIPFFELVKRWGWPHKSGGWCTREKINACNKFIGQFDDPIEYIGFNDREWNRKKRIEKPWRVKFPLIDTHTSGADALSQCYNWGYSWNGLYKWTNRVSCAWCPKGGWKKIILLRYKYPELYKEYRKLRYKDMPRGE